MVFSPILFAVVVLCVLWGLRGERLLFSELSPDDGVGLSLSSRQHIAKAPRRQSYEISGATIANVAYPAYNATVSMQDAKSKMRNVKRPETRGRRIGIFGGSFNPIHLAHLLLAEEACEVLDLEQLIFVPARLPPHKTRAALAGARERLRMVRLGVAGNPRFRVSDIELRRMGPSYTIDTVLTLRQRFGRKAELFFLIGSDTIAELPTWKEIGRLATLCTFVPLSRPGVRVPRLSDLASALGREAARGILRRTIRMPQLDISASDIRNRAATGRSIRYLVPQAVEAYIRRKGLYERTQASTGVKQRPSRRP